MKHYCISGQPAACQQIRLWPNGYQAPHQSISIRHPPQLVEMGSFDRRVIPHLAGMRARSGRSVVVGTVPWGPAWRLLTHAQRARQASVWSDQRTRPVTLHRASLQDRMTSGTYADRASGLLLPLEPEGALAGSSRRTNWQHMPKAGLAHLTGGVALQLCCTHKAPTKHPQSTHKAPNGPWLPPAVQPGASQP